LTCTPASGEVRGTALLVPGFTGSKEDFVSILPLLADAGWATASYDQRGQYETRAGDADDFSLPALAADAVAVADALLGPDPCHLLGHSFGGLVAATGAYQYVNRWADVTLMCSGIVGFGPARPDLVMFARSARTADLEQIYQANEEFNRTQGLAPESPEIAAFLKERFLANSRGALAAFAEHLLTSPSLAAPLAASGVPVHMLRGIDDDAWPHAVQDEVAATCGTTVTVIDGAGHSPAVDQPEATAAVLDSFWAGA
jgi:pimeloyl-ACP methyl ester carboxylesterase